MRAALRLLASFALVSFGGATSLYAQNAPRPERPYRGLFSGGPVGNEQSLVLNASLGGGYDSNVLASETLGFGAGTPGSGRNVGSEFGDVAGGASYTLTRQRLTFNATGNLAAQYYPVLTDPWQPRSSYWVAGTWLITPRTTLQANQGLSYDSLYSLLPIRLDDFGSFDAPVVPAAQTQSLQLETHRTITTTVRLAHNFTRRVSAFGEGLFYRTQSESKVFDMTARQLGGGLNWSVARDLDVHLGYRANRSKFETPPLSVDGSSSAEDDDSTTESSTIDAGINYHRGLSLTRRTTLAFSTGFAGIREVDGTSYSAVGSVRLNHEIGRTWSTGIGYARDVQFIQLLRQAVFTDSVNSFLSGELGPRLQGSVSASWRRGDSGGETDQQIFHSAETNAGLTFGITRNLATSFQYSFFWYDFSHTSVAAEFPGDTRRHSIRVTLNVWAPIFQRPRRPNASR